MGTRQFFAAALAAAAITVAGVSAIGTPAQADNVERPFRFTSVGTITNEDFPDCDFAVQTEGPVFLCDQEFAGVDERAMHLGRTTSTATGVLTVFLAKFCLTPEGNPEGREFESKTERTIVAANGDELVISTTVTGCGDGVGLAEPVGIYTVIGGTGRFAGASGEGEISSRTVGGILDTVWTGTIAY